MSKRTNQNPSKFNKRSKRSINSYDPYQTTKTEPPKPDFKHLADHYPSLSPYLIPSTNSNSTNSWTIDWKNDSALRELTKALLFVDFNINIDLPPNQLCPTVTSRTNYINWLNQLISKDPSKHKNNKNNKNNNKNKNNKNKNNKNKNNLNNKNKNENKNENNESEVDVNYCETFDSDDIRGSDTSSREVTTARSNDADDATTVTTNDTGGKEGALKKEGNTVGITDGTTTAEEVSNTAGTSTETPKRRIRGLDIGTGASCIYPLIGTALYDWDFLGTDIDPVSLEFARRNIELNDWNDKIQLRLAKEGTILLDVVKDGETFDFSMCNPPFFESFEQKVKNPKTVCEATVGELMTKGGELEFVSQMIRDSLVLRERIGWYTSLVGRKVNLKKLVNLLKGHRIRNFRTTDFCQGVTTRWGIAWSFTDEGLQETLKGKMMQLVTGKEQVYFKMNEGFVDCLLKIKQFLLENQIVFKETEREGLLSDVKVYESSKWWGDRKTEDSMDGVRSDVCSKETTIGPMFPPVLVFTCAIEITPTSTSSSSSSSSSSFSSVSLTSACSSFSGLDENIIKMTFKNGQIESFSELYADMKLFGQRLIK